MIICIADVLTGEELARTVGLLADGRFVDGRGTAGWHARVVKRNEQAAGDTREARQAAALVVAALRRHPVFEAAVLPRRVRPALFSRYGEGMSYGDHVDDAIMGGEPPLRSDVSVTVFLAAPESYDGGELVLDSPGGEQQIKLAAGSAVAYPSTTLHRVQPVLRGCRLVAVTWVQSLVRDPACREILFDLDGVRRHLFEVGGKSRNFDLLAKSYANLLRRWAEP